MFSKKGEHFDPELDLKPKRFLDFLDEPTRIKFLREGIHVGPAAWVGPGFERTKPWDLPEGFSVDDLEPSELRVAVRLGILTREVLTSVQREKLDIARQVDMPKGTAASLMGKLAANSTETVQH